MQNADVRDVLSDAMVRTIRSAARKLTGFPRRQFQAEVAIQYCEGSARKAERVFGWGRSAVNTGLCEKRTGMRCVDAFHLRGRKKSKVAAPQLGSAICDIEETTVQCDSTLQTVVPGVENPVAEMEAKLQGIAPATTDDSALKFDGLTLNRAGNRLQRALKIQRKKN